ncbi:MAG TPA: hypothetical protein VK611_26870 [Acidimicrobiales bacterium]|nr:hypothetical protein [Acidimicrobiales bacterium]
MTAIDDLQDELATYRLLAIDMVLAAVNRLTDAQLRDPQAAYRALQEAFLEIVISFGEQAAQSAVDYLAFDRANARQLDTPPLIPDGLMLPDQIEGALQWALRPLAEGDLERVESQLSGATQRLVWQAGRDTIADNIARAGTRFARVPQADACAFCLMLGSRGAVYITEQTARFTTGRSTASSGRPAGERYHDNCRCLPREIRDDNEDELPDITTRLETVWGDSRASNLTQFAAYLRENPFAEGVRY